MTEGRWNTGCIQGVVGCGARVAGGCAVVIWYDVMYNLSLIAF
jgi:hypothetical protein